MIYKGKNSNLFSFIFKPLLVVLLLFCVFGIVYIRSNVLTLEYNLGELEKKKMEYVRERKTLLAQKTSLLAFGKLESYLHVKHGFVMPDRIKVINVSKDKKHMPYRTSIGRSQMTEP